MLALGKEDSEVRHEIKPRVELNEEETKILENILKEFYKDVIDQEPSNIRGISRRRLKSASKKT